jgi:hypothetical protein
VGVNEKARQEKVMSLLKTRAAHPRPVRDRKVEDALQKPLPLTVKRLRIRMSEKNGKGMHLHSSASLLGTYSCSSRVERCVAERCVLNLGLTLRGSAAAQEGRLL